jgi:hypothetical protein
MELLAANQAPMLSRGTSQAKMPAPVEGYKARLELRRL